MIFLATDFGPTGPYMGQMRASVARLAPSAEVNDLVADLAASRPDLAAYLLTAYAGVFDAGDALIAVREP